MPRGLALVYVRLVMGDPAPALGLAPRVLELERRRRRGRLESGTSGNDDSDRDHDLAVCARQMATTRMYAGEVLCAAGDPGVALRVLLGREGDAKDAPDVDPADANSLLDRLAKGLAMALKGGGSSSTKASRRGAKNGNGRRGGDPGGSDPGFIARGTLRPPRGTPRP